MKRVHLPLDWIGTPTWPPFHSVLETQYGNRDVMWRSIASSTLNLNTACSINMVASFQNKEYRLVYCYWKHKSDITQNIITWKKVLKQATSQKRITYTPFHSSQHLKISVKTPLFFFVTHVSGNSAVGLTWLIQLWEKQKLPINECLYTQANNNK